MPMDRHNDKRRSTEEDNNKNKIKNENICVNRRKQVIGRHDCLTKSIGEDDVKEVDLGGHKTNHERHE